MRTTLQLCSAGIWHTGLKFGRKFDNGFRYCIQYSFVAGGHRVLGNPGEPYAAGESAYIRKACVQAAGGIALQKIQEPGRGSQAGYDEVVAGRI